MNSISPEAFMAAPPEPDEDEAVEPGLPAPTMAPAVPDEVRHALSFILDRIKQQDIDAESLLTAREAWSDLEDKYAALYALLEEIEGLIKPSTSKLANTVRDAIERWRKPEVPVEPTTPEPDHPSHDAPVEEWREYASTVNSSIDFSTMNRSQIRTELGIDQPGAES
jgi:hypothetical protein